MGDHERHALTGELLADAGHECNNQLAFILSNLQNLVEYADDLVEVIAAYKRRVTPDAELAELEQRADLDFMLSDVGRAARDALEGANRLREILRVLATLGTDDPGVVDLGSLVKEVLSVQGKPLAIRARLEVDVETPGRVEGAPSLLARLVLAMLKHAVPTVGKGVVRVNVARDGERMALSVERAGGLPPVGDAVQGLAARVGGELVAAPERLTLLLLAV